MCFVELIVFDDFVVWEPCLGCGVAKKINLIEVLGVISMGMDLGRPPWIAGNLPPDQFIILEGSYFNVIL